MLIVCAACTAPPPEDVPTIRLAQTEQADAPALVWNAGSLIAAWIGTDARGVHQDARRLTADALSEIVTLPLPPTHPYGQQIYTGAVGKSHLLWLDADQDNQTNLYTALLTPDLSVERGPIPISEGLALRFAAAPDGSGGLWTVWSGGLIAEMNLYARQIDNEGRPLQTAIIAANGSDPALAHTADGAIWLFWLANGQLMRARLDPAGETQALTGAVSLAPGDRLIDVRAGVDTSSGYFFWNITRANGNNETWFTAGSLDASAWHQPRRVQYQGGSLRWIAPLVGHAETLAAAAEMDAGLGIAQMRGGEIADFKLIVPRLRLIGVPALTSDDEGALYLAWAAPGDSTADLQLFMLRK